MIITISLGSFENISLFHINKNINIEIYFNFISKLI